jgi:hypothetical protein
MKAIQALLTVYSKWIFPHMGYETFGDLITRWFLGAYISDGRNEPRPARDILTHTQKQVIISVLTKRAGL